MKFLFVIIYFEISLGHILLVFDGFNNEKRATRLMEFISESLREYWVADIKTNYMSSSLLRVILILFPVFEERFKKKNIYSNNCKYVDSSGK